MEKGKLELGSKNLGFNLFYLLQKDVNLNDDEFLGDIMAELQQEPSAAVNIVAPAVRVKKKQK